MLCSNCYSTMVRTDYGYECQFGCGSVPELSDWELEDEIAQREEEDRLAAWHHEHRERFKPDAEPAPADDASDSTNGR